MKRRGFSIAELMIALVILGVLILIGIPQLKKYNDTMQLKRDGQAFQAFLDEARAEASRKFVEITIRNESEGGGLAGATTVVATAPGGMYSKTFKFTSGARIGAADPDASFTYKPNGTVALDGGKDRASITLATGTTRDTISLTITGKGQVASNTVIATPVPSGDGSGTGSGTSSDSDPTGPTGGGGGGGGGGSEPAPDPAGTGSGTGSAGTSDTGEGEGGPGSGGLDSINELAVEIDKSLNEAGIEGNMNNLQQRIDAVGTYGFGLDNRGHEVINSASGNSNPLVQDLAKTANEARVPFEETLNKFNKTWESLKAAVGNGSPKDTQNEILKDLQAQGDNLKKNYSDYLNAIDSLDTAVKAN